MKPTYPKMVFKVLPLNTLCITFESEHSSNSTADFLNPSKHTIPYPTFLQATTESSPQ